VQEELLAKVGGVLRWFTSKLNNGLLEGLNSLVQAAKARARGYRSIEYFKLMIYMIVGHLGLLPT
jgi:transposase